MQVQVDHLTKNIVDNFGHFLKEFQQINLNNPLNLNDQNWQKNSKLFLKNHQMSSVPCFSSLLNQINFKKNFNIKK